MSTIGTIAGATAGIAVIGGVGYGIHQVARARVDAAPPDQREEAREGLVASGMTSATLGVLGGLVAPRLFGFSGTSFGGALQAIGAMALLGGVSVAIAGSRT